MDKAGKLFLGVPAGDTKKLSEKLLYWIPTILFSVLMAFSATMYFVMNEMVSETFVRLGFPSYIIYPLGIAKILGIIAIITKKSQILKEWAYAGFFFDLILAASAHFMIGDGEYFSPLVAIAIMSISYYYDKKLFPQK